MSKVTQTVAQILIALFLVAAQDPANAGAISGNTLGFWGNIATGPLPNARRQTIPGGYIGCSVLAYGTNSDLRVYCSAKTPTGFLACYHYNPPDAMLRAVTSIGSASWLEFVKADDSNQCVEIRVENASMFM